MITPPLFLALCFSLASAKESTSTKGVNHLISEGRKVIAETTLKAHPSALSLPLRSLNWPSPPKGNEVFKSYPDKGKGLMLSARKGSEIVSPASGIIKYVGSMGNNSCVVIVDHRQQLQTIFIGLEKNSVKPGQNVYSGQRLGRLPPYGAPIHEYFFELRHKGTSIDPLPYMKRRG